MDGKAEGLNGTGSVGNIRGESKQRSFGQSIPSEKRGQKVARGYPSLEIKGLLHTSPILPRIHSSIDLVPNPFQLSLQD
jgi:hypothetical protein